VSRPGVRAAAQSCIDPWLLSCVAGQSTVALSMNNSRFSSGRAVLGGSGQGAAGAAANQRRLVLSVMLKFADF
jgi:hypothetical protein